jgi:hypothetical protein
MKMQIGEIADRYSILMLKSERTDLDVKSELAEYKNAVSEYEKIDIFIEKLKLINGRIWDLESDIRKGKENELGLEEVGQRAIMIRDINSERVACKNEITVYYAEGYIETKHTHASQI